MSDISKSIKRHRKLNGYTQKQLADKIGVSNVVMSRYESGIRTPDNDTQIKLADIFDISLDELNGRKHKEYTYDFSKFDALMFHDKEGFDDLTEDEKQELWDQLNDQLEFLINRKKKNK